MGMMRRSPIFRRTATLTAISLLLAFAPTLQARELALQERVEARKKLERVYWSHRIWPGDAATKPSFESVMPDAAVQALVEDELKRSTTLQSIWGRPVTAAQIQAEIDRIARDTRQPEILEELWSALGNDPFLIAECLARPLLVNRLASSFNTIDDRFHAGPEAAGETYVLPAIPMSACEDNTWARTRREEPSGRQGHTAVWTGSEMIVWGGTTDGGFALLGGRYNPATDTWTPTSSGPGTPSPRIDHTAVWTGSEMIIWGGQYGDDTNHVLNTGGRYNPASDTWVPTSLIDAPSGRYGHTAVWTGSEMIVWSGEPLGPNGGGRYDPLTNSWISMSATNSPQFRFRHAAVWTGTEMIVWGGTNTDDRGGLYNPVSDSWTWTATLNAPSRRYSHAAVWTGTEMIVWGGTETGAFSEMNSGGRYRPASDSWLATSTGTNVPSARQGHLAFWTGSEMLVWGGSGQGSNQVTGGRYQPATNSWLATSTGANVPAPRAGARGVWTGSEMIVWGGTDSSTISRDVDTGARYKPATDTWMPTSRPPNTAPIARSGHSAVWTGAEMIVWGGIDASGVLNSGGRYYPSTDTWLATSTGTGSPAGRQSHTAVWTGAEMIVWGGIGSAVYNSGGRYNPASNSWIVTGVGANVPSARFRHSAVWTGSEMIIWGGQTDFATYVNSGARYTPGSDSWSPTNPGGAVPAARSFHTAVWTGSDMIVWGGKNSGGILNSGSRYRPGANSWTATSIAPGVPSPRYQHTAIWSGNEMIVWGGGDDASLFKSGGRYDPGTDGWLPTSVGSNVPGERRNHSAVWNGGEMIIWGGLGPFNTGGRYRPSSDSWIPTRQNAGVPPPVGEHTAIWTGAEMIVWGGRNLFYSTLNGGRYCANLPCTLATWYRDADGDGHGDLLNTVQNCAQPAGYAAASDDCSDASSTVWHTPAELAQLTVEKNLPTPGDLRVAWDSLEASCGPGTNYQVARGTLSSLHSSGYPAGVVCGGTSGDTPLISSIVSFGSNVPGDGCWLLARGRNACGTGSYGAAAVDTAGPCP